MAAVVTSDAAGAVAASPACRKCSGSGKVGMFGYKGAGMVSWTCKACAGMPGGASFTSGTSGAGGGGGSFDPKAPPSRSSSVLDSWPVLEHEGFQYATLCREFPASSPHGRPQQTEYLPLPTGWELVPEDADALLGVSKHPWGCETLVVATGAQYATSSALRAEKCGEGHLESDAAGGYRPKQQPTGCPRVLIRCPIVWAPDPAPDAGAGSPSKLSSWRKKKSGGLSASVGASVSDVEMSDVEMTGSLVEQ